jgi:hypothetical protein
MTARPLLETVCSCGEARAETQDPKSSDAFWKHVFSNPTHYVHIEEDGVDVDRLSGAERRRAKKRK